MKHYTGQSGPSTVRISTHSHHIVSGVLKWRHHAQSGTVPYSNTHSLLIPVTVRVPHPLSPPRGGTLLTLPMLQWAYMGPLRALHGQGTKELMLLVHYSQGSAPPPNGW